MSSRKLVAAAAVVASLALSARAEGDRKPVPHVVGAVSHLLLPTSANVNGQFGAVFKTKVSIHNATGSTYDIRAGLSTGAGEIDARSIRIFPHQTLTYDNFLQQVFGFTGGGAIDLDSQNTSFVFVVSSQVYVDTAADDGTFQLAIPF